VSVAVQHKGVLVYPRDRDNGKNDRMNVGRTATHTRTHAA